MGLEIIAGLRPSSPVLSRFPGLVWLSFLLSADRGNSSSSDRSFHSPSILEVVYRHSATLGFGTLLNLVLRQAASPPPTVFLEPRFSLSLSLLLSSTYSFPMSLSGFHLEVEFASRTYRRHFHVLSASLLWLSVFSGSLSLSQPGERPLALLQQLQHPKDFEGVTSKPSI